VESAWAQGLARNPALPAGLLERLLAVPDRGVRLRLARRDDLSPGHVRSLLGTGDTHVIGLLLRRSLVDLAGVRALAADPALRWLLVSVKDLPADVLAGLAHDANASTVAMVAEYQLLSDPLADELSRHPDRRVRRGLARNTTLSPRLFARLGADDAVSFALAANPATPAEIVARLATHEEFTVRRAAAHRTDLPPETYELLAADPERGVRRPAAANPAVPEHLLRALAADPEVRDDLLRNLALPQDLLVTLESGTDSPRAAPGSLASPTPAVVRNEELPTGLLDELVAADPGAVESIMARHALTAARLRALARHPRLPVTMIVDLLGDPATAEQAAANPSLPVAVMAELLRPTT
jgi:hypothetical protein